MRICALEHLTIWHLVVNVFSFHRLPLGMSFDRNVLVPLFQQVGALSSLDAAQRALEVLVQNVSSATVARVRVVYIRIGIDIGIRIRIRSRICNCICIRVSSSQSHSISRLLCLYSHRTLLLNFFAAACHL